MLLLMCLFRREGCLVVLGEMVFGYDFKVIMYLIGSILRSKVILNCLTPIFHLLYDSVTTENTRTHARMHTLCNSNIACITNQNVIKKDSATFKQFKLAALDQGR